MKFVAHLSMLVFLLGLGTFVTVEDASAKKFGSGGFGKTFQTSPFKKATPATPNKKPTEAQPQKNGRRGLLGGGLLGGLFAGGLLAYLLGSGAFEGIQFMDILLIGLLAFMAYKFFFARPRVAHAGDHSGYHSSATAMRRDTPSAGFGSSTQNISLDLPVGFDLAGFTRGAVEHYKAVHAAWDKGDMDTLREYVSPELHQMLVQDRSAVDYSMQHRVLDVEAEVVRGEAMAQGHGISVLFKGRMLDEVNQQESGIFDVWHLQRQGNGPWLIVGIEAE